MTVKPHLELLLGLACLTFFLFIIQIALFLPQIIQFLNEFKAGNIALNFPWVVVKGILYYVLSTIICWLFVIILTWTESISMGKLFKLSRNGIFYFGLLLLFINISFIFLANQYYFPHTSLSLILGGFLNPVLTKVLFFSNLILLVIVLLLSLIAYISYFKSIYGVVTVFFILGGSYYFLHEQPNHNVTSNNKPNIFIVGIDSLRYDHVGYYGSTQNLTPYLDKFFSGSTHFHQAYTPLGRTFPAWVSILTGRYPKEHGARFDLIKKENINIDKTFPKLLQRAGYETIFATDDIRFSNIDETYGFDKLIAPKIGFNDFLLGSISVFPLNNLVANTWLGQWLFPYNYANRGSDQTYFPQIFTDHIRATLNKTNNKPLLLITHFCLPHYPYIWATSTTNKEDVGSDIVLTHQLYKESLKKSDWQFNQLINILREKTLLQNAIVMVISDHGESLQLSGDRITNTHSYVNNENLLLSPFKKHTDREEINTLNTSQGHGTDILSPSQSHVVMAARLFGQVKNITSHNNFPVTLLDIKPTLLDLAGLPVSDSSGISLISFIKEPQNQAPEKRPLYIETGFIPRDLNLMNPKLKRLIEVGVKHYKISSTTGRLYLLDKIVGSLLEHKQRGVIYDGWELALYPEEKEFVPVLVNLQTKEWTDDLTSEFAKNSPASKMLDYLIAFYGEELGYET